MFNEGVSSYRRNALFIARKRPSQMEKGVSLFSFLLLLLMKHSLVTLRPSLSSTYPN
ncbi:LacI family transcriptional regulator [Prevotella sp. A2879]|uniref:LacI family transcriptional regulator n=1 Tax=Prevotella vespertina TaxID=2608404 RepID=A0A7C9LAN7_9BACT|nr:LacI family transcriptional regulator [Prevotella vespertina]